MLFSQGNGEDGYGCEYRGLCDRIYYKKRCFQEYVNRILE